MKLHDKEREGWIYELAQTWLETGHCCDVIVTCYDQDGAQSQFRCHKVLILPLLNQHCPAKLCEEAEQVLLPDVTPAELGKARYIYTSGYTHIYMYIYIYVYMNIYLYPWISIYMYIDNPDEYIYI